MYRLRIEVASRIEEEDEFEVAFFLTRILKGLIDFLEEKYGFVFEKPEIEATLILNSVILTLELETDTKLPYKPIRNKLKREIYDGLKKKIISNYGSKINST